LFFLLMTTASALGLIKGIAFAKVLGPTELGNYGIVLLVTQFGLYVSSWGMLSALNNQLPLAFGRGDVDADELTDRAYGALIFSSVVTSVLYLGAVAVLRPENSGTWAALVLAAPVTVVTMLCEFHFLLLRVRRRLLPLAAMYVLRAVAAIALGVAAGAAWGFGGIVAAELAALALAILAARLGWLSALRLRRPTRDRTLWLIRWGAPLMVSNLVITATLLSDRAFVAAVLPEQFGQYTFASFIVVAWLAIGGMVSQAVAPQLLFEHGAGLGLRQLRWRALSISGFVVVAGGVGLIVLVALRGWLAQGPFSEYAPAVDVLPILYLGGMLSMLAFPGFILHALRPTLSTLAAVLGALTAVVGGAVLAAGQPTLTQFAWLFVASQAVSTVVMLGGVEWLVRRATPVVVGTRP
jgi:hypothetical protein